MNHNMFSSNKNDELDPNYIYPRPYIDPMMYINNYSSNQNQGQNVQSNPQNQWQNTQPNQPNNGYMSMEDYMTYMNPYISNPMMGSNTIPGYDDDNDDDLIYDDEYQYIDMNNQIPNMSFGMPQNSNQNMNMNQGQNMQFNQQGMPNMQYMPNGMMPGMMFPGMMPYPMQCMPNGMMPGMMFPGMPWMMSPYMMMPGMPQIHMEEFDEEEM